MSMSSLMCPRCKTDVVVENGGWPFIYSQWRIHVANCSPHLQDGEVCALATRLADRVMAYSFAEG